MATEDLELEQLDVKTTFLHGDLEEDIYMSQPTGFTVTREEGHLVCKLKKSLYGLKQVPRMWYQKFNTYIRFLGYNRLDVDPCMYTRQLATESRNLPNPICRQHAYCRQKSSRDRKIKVEPSQLFRDKGTRTSSTHTRHEDREKSEDKDTPALRVRLPTNIRSRAKGQVEKDKSGYIYIYRIELLFRLLFGGTDPV